MGVLVAGTLPFPPMKRHILLGEYTMDPERWSKLSPQCAQFTRALLHTDPIMRLTANQALKHEWMRKRDEVSAEADTVMVDALRGMNQQSKFRRCCFEMMAWSLSNEDREKVREYFLAMDTDKNGTITRSELQHCLQEHIKLSETETSAIFNSLDKNHDHQIAYSEFLAAMMSSHRIDLHEDLLKATFEKFDKDNSGFISKENLIKVLGRSYDGESVEQMLAEADLDQDGKVSYTEFIAYLRTRATAEQSRSDDGTLTFVDCAS